MKFHLLLLLLVIPTAFALDCANVQDKTSCNYILQSSATQQEKDQLISNLIYTGKQFPDFDAVYKWNTALDTSQPPNNIKKYSSGVIKNAWIKSLAVMPSVIDNGALLVSGKGSMQCTYGYAIQLDTKKAVGDCKTTYKLKSQNAEVKNYVNGVYQASGKIVPYQTTANSLTFTSELNVQAQTQLDHYKLRRYCCSHSSMGGCTHYCTVCEYKSTEVKTDSLKISDSILAKKETTQPKYLFEVFNKYNDNTKILFNLSNAHSFGISLGDSDVLQTTSVYETNFTAPYNILTLKATPYEQRSSSNVVMLSNNSFLVKDTNGCKITIKTHFNETIYPCNLTFVPVQLSIDTDKATYSVNDTIKVSIKPTDTFVNVSYADESRIVKDTTEFKATYPFNRITASYKDVAVDKIIALKTENWDTLFNLGTFAGASYLLLVVVRRLRKD